MVLPHKAYQMLCIGWCAFSGSLYLLQMLHFRIRKTESVSSHGADDVAFHGHSWSTDNTQKLFVSMLYPKSARKLNKHRY